MRTNRFFRRASALGAALLCAGVLLGVAEVLPQEGQQVRLWSQESCVRA